MLVELLNLHGLLSQIQVNGGVKLSPQLFDAPSHLAHAVLGHK